MGETRCQCQPLIKALHTSLQRRFSGIFVKAKMARECEAPMPFYEDVYFLSAMLDPQFGLNWIDLDVTNSDASSLKKFREDVKRTLTNTLISAVEDVAVADGEATQQTNADDSSSNSSPPQAKLPRLVARYKAHKSQLSHTVEASISDQMSKYFTDIQDPCSDTALVFWSKNKDRYPQLHALAVKLLSVPASSAPVERIFSRGGLIMRPHRARLGSRTVSSLIFLKKSVEVKQFRSIMDETQTSGDEDIFPGCSSFHQKRSGAEPSCVSMKSDGSMNQPITFKSGDTQPGLSSVQQKTLETEFSCVTMKSDESMVCQEQFKREDTWPGISNEVLNTLRSNLKKKSECLYEGTVMQGNPTLLNEIYTELYITESESGEISNEHEVRQIETQSRRTATEDTAIKCSDIFRPLPGQDKAIRTVLTKGVAGIGKTVSVQKFILDWAEGKENQDIQLIFPLPFREINLMKDKTLSLSDLLHVFFPETKEMEISSDEYKVLFIFDGLDECRLSLDFQSNEKLCNISESASVDVLLMNLIVGNLLSSALIWITSRPAAADLIPSECVHRVTEVRGFNEPQKEEYFRKRISDQSLADRIISHLKSSRSLFIMCHIPVFCWISAA
ncbi:hypothetical protein QQF64_036353, partial [Cirrhinus molitorella]